MYILWDRLIITGTKALSSDLRKSIREAFQQLARNITHLEKWRENLLRFIMCLMEFAVISRAKLIFQYISCSKRTWTQPVGRCKCIFCLIKCILWNMHMVMLCLACYDYAISFAMIQVIALTIFVKDLQFDIVIYDSKNDFVSSQFFIFVYIITRNFN